MHDIKAIRADPAAFDKAMARRGVAKIAPDFMARDQQVRSAKDFEQASAAARNELARDIGKAKSLGNAALAGELLAKAAAAKAFADGQTEAALRGEIDLNERLATLPNLPAPEVPDGPDESANVEVHARGERRAFDFPALEHDAIAARLGYDPEAAAAIAGARFAVLTGQLARLHRALGQFMLDMQVTEHGYTEVNPPLLVKEEAVFGVGQLPKFAEDLFRTTDGRYLISTAEVSLTNLVRGKILDGEALPLRFTALTPCFRSEAGAAGRDTRGLIRQHQFEKVEMVSIVHPDAAATEHERMTGCAEAVLERLGLAYRRMLLCAGDMGFAARKTYDLEVWLPGQGQYREISSCSDCGDFQARRMEARFRTKGEKGTRFVHTLNGSGLAVGRTLVAVLENYQEADGSVRVPDALLPYMGGITRLTPKD